MQRAIAPKKHGRLGYRSPGLVRVHCVASVVLLCLASSAGAMAQESEKAEVRIAKSDVVQITGMDDTFIGIDDATGVASGWTRAETDFACVHSTTGRYTLTVSSLIGGAGRFEMASSSGDAMRYRVRFWTIDGNDAATGPLQTSLESREATLTNLLASPTLSCAGNGFPNGSKLHMRAQVSSDQFNPAAPGIYTDTLVVTVSPE